MPLNIKDAPHGLSRIEQKLGPATRKGAGWLLYRGDCVGLLNQMEDSMIALTITSPPYNIGKEYEKVLKINEYLSWCQRWINDIHRVTGSNGAFWLNLGYISVPGKAKAIPLPYLLWDRIPFFLLQEVVWNYAAGVSARKTFSPRNEKFLWYVKNPQDYTFNLDAVRDPDVKYPNQKKNGKLKCNPLGKNPTDVWQFPKVTSGAKRSAKERTEHPAQFPLAVVDRIIRACSNPGDIVLDPFMGSGTVAEAALGADRLVVGFEIEPRYIEIADSRIERLFKENAQEASQERLL